LQEENIGGWTLKRNIDGRDSVEYTLDRNFTMKPNSTVTVR